MQTPHAMHGNVTTAAWIFGGALVIASLVLVIGIYLIVMIAMSQADASAQRHAEAIKQTGEAASATAEASVDKVLTLVRKDVLSMVEGHGEAIESAGAAVGEALEAPLQVSIATPRDAPLQVQMARPVELQLPIVVEGTAGENRSISIDILE